LSPESIRVAKKLAGDDHRSVSATVERLIVLENLERRSGERLGPFTRTALGMVRAPAGKTDRELLEEALMEKYGFAPRKPRRRKSKGAK
jgi:hypothetical protein